MEPWAPPPHGRGPAAPVRRAAPACRLACCHLCCRVGSDSSHRADHLAPARRTPAPPFLTHPLPGPPGDPTPNQQTGLQSDRDHRRILHHAAHPQDGLHWWAGGRGGVGGALHVPCTDMSVSARGGEGASRGAQGLGASCCPFRSMAHTGDWGGWAGGWVVMRGGRTHPCITPSAVCLLSPRSPRLGPLACAPPQRPKRPAARLSVPPFLLLLPQSARRVPAARRPLFAPLQHPYRLGLLSPVAAVGPPLAATEFRLESVPELKYDAQDSPPKVRGTPRWWEPAVYLPSTPCSCAVRAGGGVHSWPRGACRLRIRRSPHPSPRSPCRACRGRCAFAGPWCLPATSRTPRRPMRSLTKTGSSTPVGANNRQLD